MDEDLHGLTIHVDETRQQVGQGLPCARLGNADQVVSPQRHGPRLGLATQGAQQPSAGANTRRETHFWKDVFFFYGLESNFQNGASKLV